MSVKKKHQSDTFLQDNVSSTYSVGIVFDNVDGNLQAQKFLSNDVLDEHGLVNTS